MRSIASILSLIDLSSLNWTPPIRRPHLLRRLSHVGRTFPSAATSSLIRSHWCLWRLGTAGEFCFNAMMVRAGNRYSGNCRIRSQSLGHKSESVYQWSVCGADRLGFPAEDGVNWGHLTDGQTHLKGIKKGVASDSTIMPGTWCIAVGNGVFVTGGYMTIGATVDFGKSITTFSLCDFKNGPRTRKLVTHHVGPNLLWRCQWSVPRVR